MGLLAVILLLETIPVTHLASLGRYDSTILFCLKAMISTYSLHVSCTVVCTCIPEATVHVYLYS